jgi:hypothetical protein
MVTSQTPSQGSVLYGTNGHPITCPDTCPSNTTYHRACEDALEQEIEKYRLMNGVAQPYLNRNDSLDGVARGNTKHRMMEEYPMLNGDAKTPEGNDLQQLLTLGGASAPGAIEVAVKTPWSGDATQDVSGAMNGIQMVLDSNPDLKSQVLGADMTQIGTGFYDGRASIILSR